MVKAGKSIGYTTRFHHSYKKDCIDFVGLSGPVITIFKATKKAKEARKAVVQKASSCKKCGLPLSFKKLPNGKLYPTNPDGSDHWDLCAKTLRNGRKFNPKDPRDQKTSGWIRGKNYVETGCNCIPWEPCQCGKVSLDLRILCSHDRAVRNSSFA